MLKITNSLSFGLFGALASRLRWRVRLRSASILTIAVTGVAPVFAADRVQNPGFDGGLQDWRVAPPTRWVRTPDARGDGQSGALAWYALGNAVSGQFLIARQCVQLDSTGLRRKFEGAARAQADAGSVSQQITARFWSGSDCTGPQIGSRALLDSSTLGRWERRREYAEAGTGTALAPSGTQSVSIELAAVLTAASAPQVWFDHVYFGPAPAPSGPRSAFAESFGRVVSPDGNGVTVNDDFELQAAGMLTINNSSPMGTLDGWAGGLSNQLEAHDGMPASFMLSNFNATDTGANSVLSNWLLTPELSFAPDRDCFSFRTKGRTSAFADRVAVRLSTAGASTNVGSATTVGDFTTLMTVINRNYRLTPVGCPAQALNIGEELDAGYPDFWCEFRICGLPDSGSGRIGIRHSVADTERNGNFIGVDAIRFPAPASLATTTLQIAHDGPDPSRAGDAYTVSVNASVASGQVEVSEGSETCIITLDNGTGSCSLTSVGTGTRTLQASFAGDVGNSAAVASTSHTVSAAGVTPLVRIDSDEPEPSVVGQSYSVFVSVSGNSGTPTGTVTVSDGVSSCLINLVNGSGNCPLGSSFAGIAIITASYSGDGVYAARATLDTHTINPGAGSAVATVNIVSDQPDPSTVGQPYQVSVTVSGQAGTPTGAVTVSDGDVQCPIVLSAGSGSCNLVSSSTGGKTLTASYGGDSSYHSGSDTEPHQVVAAGSTAIFRSGFE